ncbi:major capsid protein [Halobacillus sp. A5]|uniref:major capsid protein n=1 Tax=Halobacillus sp. A5 TaxID=2880263 RepID=UPI0020A6B488|nr:major capsid protein [Halobacillus sp. A5]MCP3026609.1 major capsid protein [Halobacillus sp. A5]
MPLHLKEFQGEEFQGYVENVPRAKDYLLRSILPNKNTKDINFSYGVINGKYGQAASITGFNASAPLRDKKQLEKAFGTVAKVQHGTRLDEEELLRFNRPRDEEEKAQAVDYVYDTTDDLIQGVYDIEEYMRAQAVYKGQLKYDDDENDIHIEVDYNIPSENKLTVTTAWSDSSSTPLSDIQAAVKQYKKANKNRKPVVMHMTSTTEANLLQNEQIRVQVYGTENGQRLLTKNDIQNVFSALGLPPYAINDDVVDLYGDGEVQLLEDDKVVLLGENLGRTYLGPTVEKDYQSGIYSVTEIKDSNPPSQAVFIGETVFPALAKPQSIVILDVS